MLQQTYRPIAIALVLAAALASACGGGKSLILATTTSTQDSGLLDVLIPAFEEESGYNVKVVAVGTGEALVMGSRGDADVLLVHAPKSEEEFVSEGNGVNRQLVMHNDFVFAGPADDPAGIADAEDALGALQAIADAGAPFISRGDDSGTHKLELALWEELGFDPGGEGWYEESGQGMGATLQIANQRGAYTISDRGTFLSLSDTLDLDLLFEGDPKLLNIYHVMQVNPEKFDGLEEEGAAAFVAFMVSDKAQALIRDFGVEEYGQPLFIPDAGKPEDELSVP
jgi:tungstate transport system substrate-binding protein